MSEVEVVRAAPADWQDVKQTRLRALADAPYAFASTLAREQGYRDEEWRRRVTNGVWFLNHEVSEERMRLVLTPPPGPRSRPEVADLA